MKKSHIFYPVGFIIGIICILQFVSCGKNTDYNGVVVADKTKPAPPKNIRVKNFKGGANIIYDIPNADNLLYIQADYTINDSTGATRQTKTSYYTDTTIVEGFAASKDYTVTLKSITRANVASDPVTVTVHPDTPAYLSVAKSLVLAPTFGGVNTKAENPSSQGITLVYLYDDPLYGRYVVREQKYFDARDINYAMRGFDTLPKNFGVYVADRWGNKSPVTYATVNPIYEMLLDKSKFSEYKLASDIPTQGQFPMTNIWDGNFTNFFHTQYSPVLVPTPALPYVKTFGLGQLTRLSRFVFYQRNGWDGHWWSDGDVEQFSIWGSAADVPRDQVLPKSAPEGTVIGDWTNLGNFNFPLPPSGASISSPTAADIQWWNNGADFQFADGLPKVKYLRFAVSKTWGDLNVFYIAELTFYGGK